MNKITLPMNFVAENLRISSSYQDGDLWLADIKAYRGSDQFCVFEGIVFAESKDNNGTAHICGIELEDGLPGYLPQDQAEAQQSFIEFLREETQRKNDALGLLSKIFFGHEFSTEGKATSAYIAARGACLNMGVGYRDEEGKYQLLCIDPVEGGFLDQGDPIRAG